jgi:hypothetical protein
MVREGRWEEAKKRREELKAGGMTATEAWMVVMKEFGAAGGEGAPPGEDQPAKKARKKSGGRSSSRGFSREVLSTAKRPSLRKGVEWVYDALAIDDVQPEDAPSPGAYELYKWAKTDPGARDIFYKDFVKALLPSRTDISKEEAFRDDGTALSETLKRLVETGERAVLRAERIAEGLEGESAVAAGRSEVRGE